MSTSDTGLSRTGSRQGLTCTVSAHGPEGPLATPGRAVAGLGLVRGGASLRRTWGPAGRVGTPSQGAEAGTTPYICTMAFPGLPAP